MFGNTLGWIISAVITAVAAFGAYLLVLAGIPTAPTEFLQTVAKPLALMQSAGPFLKENDTSADAGALYRQAIQDYENQSQKYDAIQHESDYPKAKAMAAGLPGLAKLVQASNARCIGIFAGDPGKIINFDDHPDDLQAIDGIAKTAGMLSTLAKFDKDYPTARDYARAELVLGLRLYQERLAYLELAEGETLIGNGIAALVNVDEAGPSSSAAAQADNAFKAQYLNETKEVQQPIVAVMFNIGDSSINANAGNMFAIATGSNYDRVWRVEAIHHLGRLQFNSDNKADQVKATRVLKELSNDPKEDAIIQLAAKQSRDMTESEYQSQR
jgi:hypothetical protein